MSIRDQSCPNPVCVFFKKEQAGNVLIHSRKKSRFQCCACRKTWAANRNDVSFGLRLPKEKIESFLMLAKERKSVRMMAQELDMSPGTVQRWKKRFPQQNRGPP